MLATGKQNDCVFQLIAYWNTISRRILSVAAQELRSWITACGWAYEQRTIRFGSTASIADKTHFFRELP
jgi:hypothetical protein